MSFSDFINELDNLTESKYRLKTTKAYFKGWKVEVVGTNRFFLIEWIEDMKLWGLYELEENDVYGNKEWVEYFPNVKSAKYDLANGHVYDL